MTRKPTSAELKHAQIANIINAIQSVLCTFGRCAAWVAVAYYMAQMVGHLAGKETIAKFAADIIVKLSADRWIAYIIGGGGMVYGLRQGHLRKKTTKRLTDRVREFEKLIDPNRTSSGMPPDGQTRKEDKP